MIFEDGRDQTAAALRLLESQKDALNCPHLKIQSVPDFLNDAKKLPLTRQEKEILVDQATLLIDQFYAHLPYKRARYATDPVQRLRLIHAQLDQLGDLAFHDQMIRVFVQLRDAHTFYGLPTPYRGALVFLPFRIDCFYDESGHRHFLVTNVLEGFEHARFGVGAEITLWQGMPVERAIEREAEHEPGGNAASRFVRGLKRLTKRSLAFSVPPDEHFVVIQYIPCAGGSEEYSIALPWSIATSCIAYSQGAGSRSSVNESMAELKQLSEILWRREGFAKQKQMSQLYGKAAGVESTPPAASEGVDLRQESKYPQVFEFQYSGGTARPASADPAALQDPAHADQKFGYIRIKTFDLDPTDENASDRFVEEFTRILTLMQELAPDGLILDVRSNPGGAIDAAERILQLMTPSNIEPANFHFINSRRMQQIAAKLRDEDEKGGLATGEEREWRPWIEDLLASVISGDFVTSGRPLTSADGVNDTGQLYQGPVTLLIDASSYSATDIFAAGFQDHHIGTLIGVDENTGGGGANRWLHEDIRQKLAGIMPDVLRQLPRGAQMGLAIRRSSRVGRNAGSFLEDDGVGRDVAYRVTQNDILHHDQDLLRFACVHLSSRPTRLLKILKSELLEHDGIGLTVETRNVYRIDCFVDGLQQCSFAVIDGIRTFLVPTAGLVDLPPSRLRVDSYAKVTGGAGIPLPQLVAKATAPITSDPAAWEKAKATA